jgi:hypothetical protein
MFSSKTVFVIGAGASFDLKLPLGTELRNRIAAELGKLRVDSVGRLEGPNELIRAMKIKSATPDGKVDNSKLHQHLRAARHIAANLPLVRSIDEFVDQHAGNEHIEFMSKLAIASEILKAEKGSILLTGPDHQRRLNTQVLIDQRAWLMQLWYLLRDGARAQDPRAVFENVSFVVFNYDRCVEEFFVRALESLFQVPGAQAWEIVNELNIVHPYGLVSSAGVSGREAFGATENVDLGAVASGIRTYCESERDPQLMQTLSNAIDQANNLVFIGFAFHDQNMDFFSSNASGGYPTAYSTAVGLPHQQWDDIKTMLRHQLKRPSVASAKFNMIFHQGSGGWDLLETYGRALRRR